MANKVLNVKEQPNSRQVVNGDTYICVVDAEGSDDGTLASGYLNIKLPGDQPSPQVGDTYTLTIVE